MRAVPPFRKVSGLDFYHLIWYTLYRAKFSKAKAQKAKGDLDMKIITVSRQFGSGGRELGKRLADAFSIPCYDQQIIEMVAEKEKLDKNYVANMSERELRAFYPSTIARGFSRSGEALMRSAQLIASEQELIRKLALEGDCVIVGRAADMILADLKPFRIFVCAEDGAKLERCRSRERTDADGRIQLSDKEILKKCRELDRRRSAYRSMFTDKKWGDATAYDLCVNTTESDIKDMIPGLTAYISDWFDNKKEKN